MNKFLLAALMAFSISAQAGASSQPKVGGEPMGAGPVSLEQFPRTIVYDRWRQKQRPDGQIMVCRHEITMTGWPLTSWNKTEYLCGDDNRAWTFLSDLSLPGGYRPSAIEYRFVGTTGAPVLIVYFSR